MAMASSERIRAGENHVNRACRTRAKRRRANQRRYQELAFMPAPRRLTVMLSLDVGGPRTKAGTRLGRRHRLANLHQSTACQVHTRPWSAARIADRGDRRGKRIFVSYSHQDIAKVDPIVAEIEKLGHPVWIDRREVSGGPGWAGQIVRGLRAARTEVLMASHQAYASDQVVREMYLGMSERKPIREAPKESAPCAVRGSDRAGRQILPTLPLFEKGSQPFRGFGVAKAVASGSRRTYVTGRLLPRNGAL
jgi:hypothetical protein